MKPELIKKLKENKEAFGLMSEEMQTAMKKLHTRHFIERYEVNKTWMLWSAALWGNDTYRLRPDYQAEPEYEKKKIVEVAGRLQYYRGVSYKVAVYAVSTPNFSHFENEAGQIQPIIGVASCIREGHKVYAVFIKE